MDKLYLSAELKDIEGEKLFVASDDVEDRQGEIIDQDGWDIESYKKNPVVQWAHDPYEPAIGVAEKVGFKTVNGKKALVYQPKFHKKSDMSKLIADLVDEGIIKASSVGFRPLEAEENKFTKAELLEISFVNVPANQNALSLMCSKGYSKELVNKVLTGKNEEKNENEKLKEMSDKIEKLENKIEDLRHGLKAVAVSSVGREPSRASKSKETERRKVLKVLNKLTEAMNKLERK